MEGHFNIQAKVRDAIKKQLQGTGCD